jgi:Tfp pilus assembly protein PilN
MIEINLLPGAARKKTTSSAGPSIDYAALFAGIQGQLKNVYLIGGIGIVALALGAVGVMYFKSSHDRSVAEGRLDKALTDSTRYAGIMEARNQLTAKRDTLLRQVNLIRSIDEDRYVWPHIMDEVSRALPAYTWVTFLQYSGTPVGSQNVVALPPPAPVDPKKPDAKQKPLPTAIPKEEVAFRLTGRTVDIQALTRYMRDLQQSPFIGLVEVERADPGTDNGKEMYQFTLSMKYRRQDTTSAAIRRLPLVVTVR